VDYLDNLKKEGAYLFGQLFNKEKMKVLYQKMLESREFGPEIFLSEESYRAKPVHVKCNPSQDFNFLNQFEDELKLIEQNSEIQESLSYMLGDDYEVVIKKAICGVPDVWLPDWVRSEIKGLNVANLGCYIKPEYRDITYFRGIDFHQDIIDWPQGKTDLDPSTFLTLYVYLHDVDVEDSPLHLLKNTHKMGATLFPHKLSRVEQTQHQWQYTSDSERTIICQDHVLKGPAGYAAMWHNCTLHGTCPVIEESKNFRLSLRYLVGKSKGNKSRTGIDDVNETIEGELRPIRTRFDLDEQNKAKFRANIINSAELSSSS